MFNVPGFGFFFFIAVCCVGLFGIISAYLDKPWLIFIGFALSILIIVLANIFIPEFIYEACPLCGELKVDGMQFCFQCGHDLIDDCECGHVWIANQSYCPECGKPRQ